MRAVRCRGARRRSVTAALVSALVSTAAQASSVVAPPVLPAPGTWLPTDRGMVRVLDKQKAASQVIALKVGQTATFETLSITLDACDAHAPSVPSDSAGRLTVTDQRQGEPGYQGWMFANEPWVAMLQSPVYGVRVIGCGTPSAAAVAAAMPPPAPTPTAVPAAPTAPAAPAPGPRPPSDLSAPPGTPLGTDNDAVPPPPAPDGAGDNQ